MKDKPFVDIAVEDWQDPSYDRYETGAKVGPDQLGSLTSIDVKIW